MACKINGVWGEGEPERSGVKQVGDGGKSSGVRRGRREAERVRARGLVDVVERAVCVCAREGGKQPRLQLEAKELEMSFIRRAPPAPPLGP